MSSFFSLGSHESQTILIVFSDVLNRSESKRRPDIWYYSKEKKEEKIEFALNLIELTIPWNDAIINPDIF
jgi:hypothetical protein